MMNNYICPQNECTGCMACANICSHSAISIITDELGFRYPVINDKCVKCGLCKKVCPQINKPIFYYPKSCYAAAVKDKNELLSTASGGLATVLANKILEDEGIVVGCSGEDIYCTQHVIIKDKADLRSLKGSKYVQSKISTSLMQEIRSELVKGTKVLFIGTGCQVAGIKNFLLRKYDNLITVDLVCHGVPSQKMLNDDIDLYTDINPCCVKFRRKIITKRKPLDSDKAIQFGLTLVQTREGEHTKSIFKEWYKDPYLGSFMACTSFRECCYTCQYAQSKRQSDITLCDFWGIGKDSILSKSLGVSAVLVNSESGKAIFDSVKDYLDIDEREVEEAVKNNGQLQKPSVCPSYRKKFIDIYLQVGLKKAYRQTAYISMLKKHYRPFFYKTLLPIYRPLRSIIKKIRD